MVQSISRCIEILKTVAAFPEGIRLADAARITKLNYTTVYNLANAMIRNGLLQRGENRMLLPGPLVTELHKCRIQGELLRHARGLMNNLIVRYPEADLTYSRFSGSGIVAFLNRSPAAPGSIRAGKSLLPPYQTVAGIVFLAFLPRREASLLRGNFPFEKQNITLWGSEESLRATVGRCREDGFAQLPFDPPEMCRIGIPLFLSGALSGALTCTCLNLSGREKKKLIRTLLQLTEVNIEEPPADDLVLRA